MKVGFLHKVNTTPPQSGGSVHTYQISRYLAQTGYELLALDNEQGSQFAYRFPRSWNGLKSLMRAADVLYFRVDGKSGWELSSLVPGLIQSHKPVIWEINATLEELQVLPTQIRLRDRFGKILRPQSAYRVNAALCVSAPLVTYARDMGVSSANLAPNGSDPEMFNPKLRDPKVFPGLENHFRVVWAGSTSYRWHDFKTMVDCAAYLKSVDPEIGFAVVGNRPNLPDLEIPDNVVFYPPVPYLEVPKYFAAADVGLCLYKSITWSRYGFFFSPLKLFDYAASGVPVLYTDFPELNRVANSLGIKVAEADVADLAAKILKLKTNCELHRQLGAKARQSVLSYYNWERVGAQTSHLLQSVLAGTPDTFVELNPLGEAF
jgi:glycosyltransferase involved in cell wall biosynthesis